jgi:hypothetical protein
VEFKKGLKIGKSMAVFLWKNNSGAFEHWQGDRHASSIPGNHGNSNG